MASFACSRCGAVGPQLEGPPFGGADGMRVREAACAACFELWKREQVKLINELRLDVRDPGHFGYLMGEMKRFLGLEEKGGDDA